ncbi:uncharacterized protein L3040_009396 [Drepanopeziza brunnea f. sp. 'multigermtubi']|uniref:Uncharacterized protein n=1 Tax=Marssonina brunnea f. sp. multigermtubi (strain MB_m1) TaxID=1072389 RepID=K1WTM8_MARBU|nr:uncharacterized protein MBM_09913 [Drepanopeziza brunnea f. sp. 'multigermtubi' MB_m1]EKD11943.1 hypothetical protein MBM_09913 [Drepanopeziza brunnea f. sp. 'multigermtubi' MB_m1]KAJ5032804.1 hypothetical protein L3040_009396 [Drepanopeziza brunnea f. sp. 'multigermtubi']
MSLSRAFTRRVKSKQSFSNLKISAPVELLSTTNMLSYNAPDIYPSRSASTSSQSGDESDKSLSDMSTPMTSADCSSVESSPIEPNHLSCYFGTVAARYSGADGEAPRIPRRSQTHTKQLSIERSIHRGSVSQYSRKNSTSTVRSSINMFGANIDSFEPHPFGNELAQVTEIAEDYGIAEGILAEVYQEEQELIARGLFKFGAEDYMSEIHNIFMGAFGPAEPTISSAWI